MVAQTHTRYPGAQPFADDAVSRKLFYGREQESTALTHQILANRLVLLFARSGLGKTSLLNAGVADHLRAENYLPLSLRVNDIEQGPIASLYKGITQACEQQSVEYVPGDTKSLWHFFKTAQFWKDDILLTPVLILDQFEELFTLHSEEKRGVFLDKLSNLVRGIRPQQAESQSELSSEQDDLYIGGPPAVKIVISMREDFLAQLDEFSDRIPGILDQRFRLLPLSREAATKAMEAPAEVEDASLMTRPFQIGPKALDIILDFLEKRATVSSTRLKSNIEPFQLQLICQRLEEIARNAQRKSKNQTITVDVESIGGELRLRKILTEFYKRQVAAVPSFWQRRGVRKLCSEFLINPQGRRLRLEESEIKRLTGVKPKTLKTLVELRLLRRDQSTDSNYYELSHDSLIVPIINSVRLRFFFRMAFFLLLAIALVAYPALILFGMAIVFFDSPGDFLDIFSLDVEDMIFFSIGMIFVLFLGYWGLRNFRRVRELWRRFKI